MEQILKDLIALTGFSEQDCQILRESAPRTQQWANAAAAVFYDTLYGYGPTARVFKEGERTAREQTLLDWYRDVTSGMIDDDFWRRQWIVGLIHLWRGVENQFMCGMMSRVQQLFLTRCMEEFPPAEAVRVYGAFKRVSDVVEGLIVEGYRLQYLEAVERVSGVSRSLIDHMAMLETRKLIDEARGHK